MISSFKNHCTCGGFAWSMNGRPQSQPHMTWCPQYAEYAEWWAVNSKNPGITSLQEKLDDHK